jgi:hypothetical protein
LIHVTAEPSSLIFAVAVRHKLHTLSVAHFFVETPPPALLLVLPLLIC